MFFIVSKIFWMLVMPLNALCFLALTGFALRFWRKRVGDWLLGFALVSLLILGIVPIGPGLVHWLETRYEVPDKLPARVDGIIVLGGMFDQHMGKIHNELSANDNIERMFCFTKLSDQYPNARKLFSGGSGDINNPDDREADSAYDYIELHGTDPSSVLYEKDSRNTYENAVFSKELINPTTGQNWILVTSGYHMPRSVGIFKTQKWDVIPYSCDFKTGKGLAFMRAPINVTYNFRMLDIAVKELIGSVVYYATGKSAFILPPRTVQSADE